MNNPEDDPFAKATVLGVLDETDRRYLAERSHTKRLAKGQFLFFEGGPSDSVLVLTSGRLKVLAYSADGTEFIVNEVRPGETIGEMGVLSGDPRSATIQAIEPSVVLSLSGAVLLDMIAKRPVLAIALLRRMARMVCRLTGVAADLVFLDLTQRVAKYLLDLTSDDPQSAGSTVTQSQLAATIGASRQRVNACLRDFHKQGLIALEPRRLRVLDRDALHKVVGS